MLTLGVVTVGAKIGLMVLGIGLSILAGKLLAEQARKSVISDDKPTTLSQRGAFVPLLVGRRRLGAIFAWAGDRRTRNENISGGKGGKGGGGIGSLFGGGKQKQKVFLENGWHVLCVGPAFKIWRIWQHGEIIFGHESQEPLTPATHPSGSTVDFGSEGLMTIFWGEIDQPINTDLGDPSRIGISSRWPFLCYVYWETKRLGTSPVWPLIEYEVEVRPLNSNVSGSDAWVEPDRGTLFYGFTNQKVFALKNFTSTKLSEFASDDVFGISTMDLFDDNVIVVDNLTNDIRKYKGFSSTVLATISATGSDTDARDCAGGYRPTQGPRYLAAQRLYFSGNGSDKLYEMQDFSTTQLSSLDISTHGQTRGFSLWNDGLTFLAADAIFFATTGGPAANTGRRLTEFTTTVKTVVDYTALTTDNQGMSADGPANHVLLGDTSVDLLRQFTGFTTTQNATVDTSSIDTNPRGIAHQSSKERLNKNERLDYEAGANAAHMTDQFLFEKYPHGIGLKVADFDIPSLDGIGTAVDFQQEYIPTHVVFTDGEKFQAGIAALMQDVGFFISWDVVSEKYVFKLLREPTGLLPAVTLDLQVDKLPERTTMHDDLAADRIIFSFSDRDRNYKDTTLSLNDDGQAELVGATKARDARLTTITDFQTAQKVTERRAQEEMVAPTRFKIKSARAFRKLVPGEPFTLDGFAPVLRLMAMGLDTESDQVVLDCIVDSYGLSVSTALSNPGGGIQPNPDPDFLDLQFTFYEMNKYLAEGRTAIFVPRLRSNVNVVNAHINISRNDVSYIDIGINENLYAGGVLRDAVALDKITVIDQGPEFDIIGPDIGSVQDLSGDDFSWKAGRQIAIINDELFFVQKITIISATVARLDGLIRARLGTSITAHGIGDEVYIIDKDTIEAMQDVLIIPRVDLWVKSQPNEQGLTDLDDITAVMKTLKGDGIRGLPVENINSDSDDRTWPTGSDLEIDWSYRSTIEARTGAGQQGAGEPTTVGTIQGTFTVRIRDIGDVLKNTFEGLTTNALTYTNAQMVTDFAGEPASLKVEVVNVDNGIESDIRIVTMELN